ncbi:hypothetical protein AX16_002443 [Volvariella volvacea WC 439]|nr:hypothetical protein AX16_002443 [Volvariella volvacea WC 439]
MAQLCNQYIPQELINNICAHLSDDIDSLSACSLVASPFTEPAQRQLFHTFTLRVLDYNPRNVPENIQKFRELLDTLTSQLEYVHTLYFRIGACGDSVPIVNDILDRLVNLKEVFMNCNGCVFIDPELVFHCCKPTLTHFSIMFASSFPANNLHRCTSLQQLSITYSTFSIAENDGDNAELSAVSPIQLDSLYLAGFAEENVTYWVQHPKCPVDICNLTTLTIKAEEVEEIESIVSILPMLSHSLRSLVIEPPEGFESIDAEGLTGESVALLDLSTLPHLTHLTFSIFEASELRYTYFPWLVSQLSTISPVNGLRSLNLLIAQRGDLGRSFTRYEGQYQKWEHLDDTLTEERFEGLRNIHLYVHTLENDSAFIEGCKDALPKTKEAKLLIVERAPATEWRGIDEDLAICLAQSTAQGEANIANWPGLTDVMWSRRNQFVRV